MKILLLDIETSPNTAYVWGLWKQNVSLSQMIESSRTMCFAAKWLGDDNIIFHKEKKHANNKAMVKAAHKLLDKADAVIHFNGKKFDIPTLNKEFLLYGMNPPSPYHQIDLMVVAKSEFRFPSNKLQYIAGQLGVGGKVQHEGFELWVKCMAGEKEAWDKMEKYNRQDVFLLEDLYLKLRPWIKNHPNYPLYGDMEKKRCPKCNSSRLNYRGYYYTTTQTYRRLQCKDCGGWSRTRFTEVPTEDRRKILTNAR